MNIRKLVRFLYPSAFGAGVGLIVLVVLAVRLEANPKIDGVGPRMYQGTCNAYPPRSEGIWMHAFLTPIDASVAGWSKNNLMDQVIDRLKIPKEPALIFNDFYTTLDPDKPLVNMPTLDHPSMPSGFIRVRTLAKGKLSQFLDKTNYIRLENKSLQTIKTFDLDPDRFDYYSCGFHATQPIDWCVTDYPYSMNVPLILDQCTQTFIPHDKEDIEQKIKQIDQLKLEGWIPSGF